MWPSRGDVLLAVGAAAAVVAELALTAPGAVSTSGPAVLALLALAARRRRPLATVAVISAAMLLDSAAGGVLLDGLQAPLAVLVVACLSLGRHGSGPPRVALGTAGAVAAMTAANHASDAGYPVLDDIVFFTLVLGAPAVLGALLRGRSAQIERLTRRAAELEAARAQEAAAAVAEERARLAFDVHDAVAHRVGEISLQAAGAARVAEPEPERALEALARIEAAGRAALDDIREVIGVLRHEDLDARSAPPAPAARPAPPPSQLDGGALPGSVPAALRRHADLLIAAAVLAALAVDAVVSPARQGPALANVLGAAAVAAPLVVRRRRPLVAAAGVFAAAFAHGLVLTPLTLLVTPIVLLLLPAYSVAAHLPLRPAVAGLGVCLVGSLALEPSAITGLLGLLAWGGGRVVRDRARREERLRAITLELERTRGAAAARARGEERLRVARELHDAVAHSLTVIVLQAGAAQRVWGRDPAAALVATEALASVARDTLAELRDGLRDAGPAGGLAGLAAIAAGVRELGVELELEVDVGRELPPATEHLCFLILREALTNVARHAAPTSARAVLTLEDGGVRIGVTDAGRRGSGDALRGSGTGLRGLAERVAAHGGELRAGSTGSGFAVEARLPVREAVPA